MIAGLVLAAGAGTRMGMPKALVEDESGPWLSRAVQALTDGGCDDVTVVLGAAVDEAAALVPGTAIVVAEDWAEGMGASLRAGLTALADRDIQPTPYSSLWSTCRTSAPTSYAACSTGSSARRPSPVPTTTAGRAIRSSSAATTWPA